jgi:hypothetical protein
VGGSQYKLWPLGSNEKRSELGWRPDDARAVLVDDRLSWRPDVDVRALEIDVRVFFADVADQPP